MRLSLVRPLALLALLLVAPSCADGGGTGTSCVAGDYDYPQSTLPNGVTAVSPGARARVTQAGLDFLQARLPALLEGLDGAFVTDPTFPEFFRIEVVDEIEVVGTPRIALGVDGDGDWATPTRFWLNRAPLEQELRFAFQEGDPEGIAAHVEDLVIGIDGRLYTDFGVSEAACDLVGTNTGVCPPEATTCAGLPLLTTASFDVFIYPRIAFGSDCNDPNGGACYKIVADVANVELGPFDQSSVEIDPAPNCNDPTPDPACSPECSDTGVFDSDGDAECLATCGLQDFVADAVSGLAGALESLLDSVLDDFVANALGDALADIDGQSAELTGTFALDEVLTGIATGGARDLGFLFVPTPETFDVNCAPGTNCDQARGMDFLLRTGFEAVPVEGGQGAHPCVVPLDTTTFEELYGATDFEVSDTAPLTGELDDGTPYHFGASLSLASVNQAMFAAYNSGALCIELDSDGVWSLTDGGFNLSAGLVNTLSGQRLEEFADPSAPAVLTVVPSEPPVARFGAGDDSEGHLVVTWDRVVVGFYVVVNHRFARVFAVETNLTLELAANLDATTGELELSVVRGPTVEGFEEVYSELLPDVPFDEVLEGLLGVALDQLLGDTLSFAFDLPLDTLLTDITGVPIGLEFQGLETLGAGAELEFLTVYFSLMDGPSSSPRTAAVPSRLRLQAVEPRSVLLAGELQALPDGVEALARTDGGLWRGPFRTADGALRVGDPKLAFTREHVVELRLRRAGSHGAWQPAEPVRFWVDGEPPRAALARDGDALVASATDIGSPADRLRFAWALDGAWGDYDDVTSLPLASLDGVRRVSVRARDEAGNVSSPVTIDLAAGLPRRDDRLAVAADAAGCAAGAPADPTLWLWTALLPLAVLARRRARGLRRR